METEANDIPPMEPLPICDTVTSTAAPSSNSDSPTSQNPSSDPSPLPYCVLEIVITPELRKTLDRIAAASSVDPATFTSSDVDSEADRNHEARKAARKAKTKAAKMKKQKRRAEGMAGEEGEPSSLKDKAHKKPKYDGKEKEREMEKE
ncbi:hypothetical protein BC938DRAFT_477689, partial [Jimgerdemannia flammicorona]